MNDPTTPESIAMTLRHDFGLLEAGEQARVLREARQIHEHHVAPLLADRAELLAYIKEAKAAAGEHYSGRSLALVIAGLRQELGETT